MTITITPVRACSSSLHCWSHLTTKCSRLQPMPCRSWPASYHNASPHINHPHSQELFQYLLPSNHVCFIGFVRICFYLRGFVLDSLRVDWKLYVLESFLLDSWISVFVSEKQINIYIQIFVCACARSLTKPFFRLSQPGSCAWLSPFLLCADCTCVLVRVCLCMCMWKCVGEVENI